MCKARPSAYCQRANAAAEGCPRGCTKEAEGRPARLHKRGRTPARGPPAKKGRPPPKNKPSAEPLVRRDPDRICLDDGRVFLAGESPDHRPPPPRAFNRARRQNRKQASPLSFAARFPLFAALRKQSRSTEERELAFLNAVLCQKKHESCSNQSRTTNHQEGKAATTAAAKAAEGRKGQQQQQHACLC